jgi:hypothetical protein
MAYSFDVALKLRLFEQCRQATQERLKLLWVEDRIIDLQEGRPGRNQTRVLLQKRFDLHAARIGLAISCRPQPQIIGFHPHQRTPSMK